MNIDTKKLKAFLAVAQTGNYRKAETLIKENYATIRKWLISLEKDLGTPLVTIKDKKIVLTEQGEDFRHHAQNIIATAEKEITLFQDNKKDLQGQLTIATTHAFANLWLIPLLEDFFKQHPTLNICIIASDEDKNLINKEADVSISLQESVRDDIKQRLLIQYKMDLYASKSYIKKHGQPTTLEDLKKHSIISYSAGTPYPYEQINWHLKQLPQNYVSHITINSGAAILQLVEKGIGIGSISDVGAQYSKTPLVKILPNLLNGPQLEVFYRYPKYRENSRKINALYIYLKSKFKRSSL